MKDLRAATLVLLVTLAGCSGSSSSSGSGTVTVDVLATEPPNGATDIEPDVRIRLILAAAPVRPIEQDVSVVDGEVELAGSFSPTADPKVFGWQPERELPRGAELEVRVRSGGGERVVSVLGVREVRDETVHELPVSGVDGVLAWPGGRRVVLANARAFEVEQAGFTEIFVPLRPDSQTFGEDGFVHTFSGSGGVTTLVRGDLSGAETSLPTPENQPIAATNARGDVVVFVTLAAGTATTRGPWLLRAGDAGWQWLGSLELPEEPIVDVDDDGNVYVAYVANDRPSLARFVPGSLVPEVVDLVSVEPATSASIGVDASGQGFFAWRMGPPSSTYSGVWTYGVARYTPERGLEPLPSVEAASQDSPPGSHSEQLVAMHASSGGVGIFPIRFSSSESVYVTSGTRFQRIRRDGSMLPAESLSYAHHTFQNFSAGQMSPLRGEVWRASWNGSYVGNTVSLQRSRPGAAMEPFATITAQTVAAASITSFDYAFDDSGRAVFAIGVPTGTRILVWD